MLLFFIIIFFKLIRIINRKLYTSIVLIALLSWCVKFDTKKKVFLIYFILFFLFFLTVEFNIYKLSFFFLFLKIYASSMDSFRNKYTFPS